MHNKEHAQSFKNERMERMTNRKSMPNTPPVRDPRVDGLKNPSTTGEQMTLQRRVKANSGTKGPRPGAYKQASGPGMLPR